MKMNFKHGIVVLAIMAGVGLSGGAAQAMGAPFFQDHEQDYSKNKRYHQGMSEGKADQVRNRDHSKKRHYKKDQDRKAYEAGYQRGRTGN